MKIRKPTPAGAVLAGVVLVLSLGLVPAAFAAAAVFLVPLFLPAEIRGPAHRLSPAAMGKTG